ncbi:MAG: hypothetical protein FP831_08500 [Anaerolineae bacterium]|nr:hypothetical protein [Anaerolineae bacterium]
MLHKFIAILIVISLLLTSCNSKNSSPQNNDTSDSTVSTSENTTESALIPETNEDTFTNSGNLGNALNLTTGGIDVPSVFPSYHIELTMDTPQPNEEYTGIVNQTIKISADVAGNNVHIFQIDPETIDPKEGYIIGDTEKEYKLVDGVWEEMMGQIALGWAMWPLTVVMPYAYACALYSNELGTEEVDGRKATVYELDTAKTDPATLASMEVLGPINMSGKGKVWIDKETGGMLKLELDYTTELSSLDGSTNLGIGSGYISLEISQVGDVTVTSPL